MDKNISLNVKCPHCGKSLMDSNKIIDKEASVKLNVIINGNLGTIWLSSVYGSYNYESNLDIKLGDVGSFSCPECNHLLDTSDKCEACEANLVKVCLPEGGKVAFCSRAGCQKHLVEIEDLETALEHFYKAFPYGT